MHLSQKHEEQICCLAREQWVQSPSLLRASSCLVEQVFKTEARFIEKAHQWADVSASFYSRFTSLTGLFASTVASYLNLTVFHIGTICEWVLNCWVFGILVFISINRFVNPNSRLALQSMSGLDLEVKKIFDAILCVCVCCSLLGAEELCHVSLCATICQSHI